MAKIKIGELYNKPIVKGDKNLVENHEIYVDDLINGSQGGSTTNELKRNDVNFFDYDGTLLYAYSWEEAKNLKALPALPKHEGLEVREWNYTLEDIKEQEGISYMINGESCMYVETASVDGVEYGIYTNIDYSYVDYYAIKATDTIELGTKCVGCRFRNNILTLYEDNIYYVENIFTSIGKVDVGACVYDSNGNQVKVLGVHIYERNISEDDLTYYDNEIVEVISIPASLSEITDMNFQNSLFLQDLKIPKNSTFANNGYDTFNNCQVNNAYINGAGREYFALVYPLQVFNIPDNTITISIPWGCVMNMPESILKITSDFFTSNGSEISTFVNFTKAKGVPSIEAPQFEDEKLVYVVVPDELYSEWINSTNWSSMANSIYKHSDVPWLK